MTESIVNAPVPTTAPAAPTRRAAVVLSAICIGLGALELLAGGLAWYVTAIDTSDDPLVGLGYLVALAVGVPGAAAVLLGALGWALARRTAGLVLGILAALAAAGPLLLMTPTLFPAF